MFSCGIEDHYVLEVLYPRNSDMVTAVEPGKLRLDPFKVLTKWFFCLNLMRH